MKVEAAAPSNLRLVAALVTALAAFRYCHDIVKLVLAAPTIDFATHYGFTAALWHGVNPFQSDGRAWMDAALGMRRAGTPPTIPPGGYLIVLPFVALPYAVARMLWLAIGQACLAATVVALQRRFALEGLLAVSALFVTFSYQPIMEDVALANVNLVVLALVTLTIVAHAKDRIAATALPLSVAVMLKLPYVVLIPFVWWLGAPATAALALAFTVGWCALAALVFGTSWLADYAAFLSAGSAPLHAWPRNVSPHAVLHRLTGVLTPDARIEVAAIVVAVAVVAGVLIVTRDARSDPDARTGAWALALAALPLASPLAEENHFVVQLVPLLFVLSCAPLLRATGERVMLLAAIVLLASRYSLEDFPALSQGVLSLAQTGKIVGMALLAALIARLVGRRGRAD